MSTSFEIRGGTPLNGEVTPQGAKNEALQVISAVLLSPYPITIKNIPDIIDVRLLIELLEEMGVQVKKHTANQYTFCAKNINLEYLISNEYKKKSGRLRGAVMLAGPLLARFKKAYIPQPGGDKIGRRRLDTHILGFEKLGVSYSYHDEEHFYTLKTKELKGTYLLLDEPSVTGTANILMAAIAAKGKTRIYNAACEPYIQQLCRMLNRMGARISGVGSNLLTINGVEIDSLKSCEHEILADMIEVGSFIGLAAMTGGDIRIKNCNVKYLGCIPDTFARLGIQMEFDKDNIHIPAQKNYKIKRFIGGDILTIYDHPWPGFTPDLLSIALVVATQAKGTVLFHQKMFESRLFFTDKLIDMGAQIVLCDPHRAVVVGLDKQSPLRGNTMSSPDIRAGLALLIAALSAQGKSIIQNGEQIDRGYENIDIRLQKLGANIKRI
ncbi:MAG: UDP-N-acetylglucosamine 1-carboxyvinyltransferase [Chitinophagaceae bacterium]|nr:MAG: UDP-N-acetylglucosamine 1-carboxyvinyltransferase [Bacteroidetes bacterium OLB11]MCC6447603.1 UDP-N-acetylglucosamine 1-carboxyvinyltransferase [Chitinophagaceae bacterium]HMN32417.1 UDP-N-acetylglucosamine 1-carboxyvinyltransferase [Chitinophagaceae bacterium]